ncbi:MAG: sugar kinase [Pseudomonadota bacterium]
MKFLAIGECMLELSPTGEAVFAQGFAGDTFNTAWYVAQLSTADIKTQYLTAVGDDLVSANLIGFMQASNVTPIAKVREGRSIGLYMIVLQNAERSFLYWRDSSAARTLADDLDELPLQSGDVAYFSGITLAILPEAGRQRLMDVLHANKARGTRIVFDPNLRPKLWSTAEEMRSWIMKGAAIADICLPSFDDEATFFGDEAPSETCRRYRENGSRLIVVKDGPNPVWINHDGHVAHVDIEAQPNIVDTTAAGDSFNAQFCLSYFSGSDPCDAAAAAAAISRIVISKPGALVHLS